MAIVRDVVRPVVRPVVNAITERLGINWSSYWAKYYVNESIVELQPDAATGKDTTIYSSAPTKNRGVNINIAVGEVNTGSAVFRGLIQFDLSTLPSDAIITGCRVHFHIINNYASTIRDFKLYRLKRAWLEGTGNDTVTGDGATWNTYNGVNNWATAGAFDPADCEQIAVGVAHIPQSPTTTYHVVEFNLSPIVKSELDLGYGWLIKADTETNDAHAFLSSDYVTDVLRRPGLFISYLSSAETGKKTFTRSEYNPMIYGLFGTVWYNGAGDYVFYYSDGTNVLRATSTDGLVWVPDTVNNPVMTPLAGVIDVVNYFKEGTTHYMLYRSNEWAGTWGIGLATSANGIAWTKEATNPVFVGTGGWEGTKVDPVGIIKVGATYYMWINDVGGTPRQSGLLTSTNLKTWTADPNNPIFDNGRYCPTVIKKDSWYYLFMPYTPAGSYDVGALNHRIELYKDTDPRFLPSSRKYLGYILTGGGLGSWDNLYLDTPTIITNDIQRDSFPTGDEVWMYYCGYEGSSLTNGWQHGLAVGSFTVLERLQPLTEPAVGE